MSQSLPDYLSGDRGANHQAASGGNMQVTEVGWAGSVSDEGVWDPDDVFIEFQNKHPRPINLSGWRPESSRGIKSAPTRFPHHPRPGPAKTTSSSIAAQGRWRLSKTPNLIIPELKLGKAYVPDRVPRPKTASSLRSAGSTQRARLHRRLGTPGPPAPWERSPDHFLATKAARVASGTPYSR